MALETTISRVSYSTDGSTTVFSYPYYFLASADIVVVKRLNVDPFTETTLVLNTGYTVAGAGVAAGGSITTTPVIVSGYTLSIFRNPPDTQGLHLVENDESPASSIEMAFDRLTMIAQAQGDLISRSVKLSDGYPADTFDLTLPPNLAPNTVFIVNSLGTGLDSGPTAADIEDAEANAAVATAAALAAAASATTASASATSATASAAAATAQLASAFFRDTLYKVFADSPIVPVLGNNGKLFSLTTTGGAIVINLPTIVSVGTPFNLAFKLEAGVNSVTINRGGSNTIDGGTSITLTVAGSGILITADSTNNWSVLSFGPAPVLGVVSKTGNYNLTALDSLVLGDSSGGTFTLTLPTAVGNSGKQFILKKNDSSFNAITIATTSAQTIDGSTTRKLATQHEAMTVISDGSNWQMLDRKIPTIAASYTPTTQGFGTPTGVEVYWKRLGDSILIEGNVTSGTVDGSEARINLPSGLTSTAIPSLRLCGSWNRATSASPAQMCSTLISPSVSYFNFSALFSTSAGLTPLTGNNCVGSAEKLSFQAIIPVTGWDA